MKKKKISLKLVTLVMSGTLLATPMVSSAEEAGNNSTTSSTNALENTGGAGSTTSPSAAATGTGSNASPSAAVARTGTTASTTAAATGTGSPVGTVTVTPVDPSTTLPNNVDTVIPSDEMKGTKIESSIWGRHIEYDPDLGIEAAPVGPDHTEIKVNISPEESKGEETLTPTFGSAFFDLDTPDYHPSRS